MPAKHTPGPWFAGYNGDEVCIGTDNDEFVAMTLPCGADVATARDYANARLIAAAPALLAVLKELASAVENNLHCGSALRRAHDTITKAEGES